MGGNKLLPENSVMKLIPFEDKPFFTELILMLIRQNTIPYGQGIINAFDHMELCLVINLTLVVTGLFMVINVYY